MSQNDTRQTNRCVVTTLASAGDFSRHEVPRRAGILLDEDRPALVLTAELGNRHAALALDDRSDQMDTTVTGGVLQNLDGADPFFGRKVGKGGGSADHCTQWRVRGPAGEVGKVALDLVGESRRVRRVHYALEGVCFAVEGSDVTPMRRQIQRGSIDLASRHQYL